MTLSPDPGRIKAANHQIVERMRDDLAAFWSTLDLSRPQAARAALLEFVPLLTDRYGELAAVVAADWYDEAREAAGVAGRFTALPADLVPANVVQNRTRFGAQHLWTPNPDQTRVFLASALSRYVLQPGWDTIQQSAIRDPAASGWRRVARADGCDFCRMLAGRGGVFRRSTVRFASHDDCNCGAAPDWDPTAPEVDVMAYTASQRTTAMGPEQHARHNARVRAWIETNLP